MQRKKFDAVLKSVSSLFRILSHPDRVRLIGLLQKQEMAVSELQQALGVSQSVVSQHLKLFRFHGLVNERKYGTHVFYSLKNPMIKEVITAAIALQAYDASQINETTLNLLQELSGLW